MTGEVALKACAEELLAVEMFPGKSPNNAGNAVGRLRRWRPRPVEIDAALRAIEKALTRSPGWQDELVEVARFIANHATYAKGTGQFLVSGQAIERLKKALAPLPSSPSGERV